MFFNDMFELYQLLMDNNSRVWQNNFVVSISKAFRLLAFFSHVMLSKWL